MKSEKIKFSTAELANTKGCDFEFIWSYIKSFEKEKDIQDYLPTQSELQEWIRTNHKIHIQVVYTEIIEARNPWYFYLIDIKKRKLMSEVSPMYKTYELALEEGLKLALEQIKTQEVI